MRIDFTLTTEHKWIILAIYYLMLRSLENLEFFVGNANGFEVQMGTQGKVIEMPFDLQALQFEERIQNSKDMIILGYNSAHRRLAQGGILFERFVEDFYRPSFLIGR